MNADRFSDVVVMYLGFLQFLLIKYMHTTLLENSFAKNTEYAEKLKYVEFCVNC